MAATHANPLHSDRRGAPSAASTTTAVVPHALPSTLATPTPTHPAVIALLDITDQYGKTALHLAVETVAKDHSSSVEYEEVIALLEKQGDDETVRAVKEGTKEGGGDDEAALFEKLAVGGAGERAVAHAGEGDDSSDDDGEEEERVRERDGACDANAFVQRRGTRTRAVVKVYSTPYIHPSNTCLTPSDTPLTPL